jgi:alginate O-acetyltransferase complex protein AlgI
VSLTSTEYGLFLAGICVLLAAVPARWVPPLLLGASLIFYFLGRPLGLLTLGLVTMLSYVGGRMLATRKSISTLWLWILPTLAPLVLSKCFKTFTPAAGVSFFTLQAVAYLVDVYRAAAPAERSLWQYCLFLSFFPLVLSGPIERAAHLLPQLKKRLVPQLPRGVFLFLEGLVLKLVFADNFAGFVDRVYSHISAETPANCLLAFYLYGLQIYCDFYGYTLLALGSAALLGIDLINNFEHPYLSTNIQRFWSTWHISLTNWLRDYIYFSLGGLRQPWKRYRNLIIVWLLAGLWHGVGITFLIWGAMHGVALVIYHFSRNLLRNRLPRQAWFRTAVGAVGWLVTFHFVLLAWVPFRAGSWRDAMNMLAKIGQAVGALPVFSPSDYYLGFLIRLAELLVVFEIFDQVAGMERLFLRSPVLAQAAWLGVWCCFLYFAPITNAKFIYFQF